MTWLMQTDRQYIKSYRSMCIDSQLALLRLVERVASLSRPLCACAYVCASTSASKGPRKAHLSSPLDGAERVMSGGQAEESVQRLER